MFYIGTALIEGMLGEEGRREKGNVTVHAHLVFANLNPAHKGTQPVPERPLPYHAVCEHYLVTYLQAFAVV
jgi:hypothetical protein